MSEDNKLTVELEGAEGVRDAMKLLEDTLGPSAFDGIQLLDQGRSDGVKNVDILVWQRDDQQRDIITLNEKESNEIAQAYVDRLMTEMQHVLDRQSQGKMLTGREGSVVDKLALEDAMRVYMTIISKRIEDQVDAFGGQLKKLSPAYAGWKQKKFGFVEPILKASGQLIAILNPTGRPSFKFTKNAPT